MTSLHTRTLLVAAIVVGALLTFVISRTRDASSMRADVVRQQESDRAQEAADDDDPAKPPAAGIQSRSQPQTTAAITPAEWKRRLETSTDYFQFVSEAAVAGLAGDGRAALLVSEILPKCQLFKLQYARAADPRAAFEDHLATLPGRTPAGDELQRKDFERCQRFLSDEPFKTLQLGAEGSTSPYWRRLAEQNNDPLARIQHVFTQRARSADDDPTLFLDTVRSDLAVVIPSKDTDALFNAGKLLLDSRISKDPLRGVAWMIVAVEAGYDGPDLRFPTCGDPGPCPDAADFKASLQNEIGAARYSHAYAQAQEIKDLMAREDWAALERFWLPDVPSR